MPGKSWALSSLFYHDFVYVAPADSVSLQNHCWHNIVRNNKEDKYTGTLAWPPAAQHIKYTKSSDFVCTLEKVISVKQDISFSLTGTHFLA